MIITADWVVPVARPPIHNGAVHIASRAITAVGTREALLHAYPATPVADYPGCVIIPGLVNAHTRLSHTVLEGLVPPMPLARWTERTRTIARMLQHGDLVTSAVAGALRCIETGATVVGDITHGPEGLAAAADMGLGGVFSWQVGASHASELERLLAESEFPDEQNACLAGRIRCGLSISTPFVTGPGVARETVRLAREWHLPVKVRLARAPGEVRLLATGEGPFAELAAENAPDFVPPRTGAVQYADSLGALEGATALHCAELASGEADLLAAKSRGVVLCPRSNRYLHCDAPPVSVLHEHGVRMALGTDTLAANETMDLFAEARAVKRLDPTLGDRRILAMLTLEGARVLGVDDTFGSLETGKQADLVVLSMPSTDDPVRSVIEQGSPSRVRAVMSHGMWRFLDGDHAGASLHLEHERQAIVRRLAGATGRTEAEGPSRYQNTRIE